MTPPPLEREAIFPRIDGIGKNVKKLQELAKLPLEKFTGDSFDLAQHHLRLALEGGFHIASHVLSRLPGGRAVEYKEIARKMGELQILSPEFVQRALVPMAGMRNILVHFYADIDTRKLYDLLQNHLVDIDEFLHQIKSVLADPQKFGLRMD